MAEMIDESSNLESTTVGVYRTASTVKGGRRFSFGALVVVGNRNGQVGFGYAKSKEVPQAIEKAQKYAKRNMVSVNRIGTTINHEVLGRFSSAQVKLIPAAPGTGVVAGTVVRSILDMAGVSDCLSKCFGSTNARNTVKAAFAALEQIRQANTVAELRGLTLERTLIEDKIERGKAFAPARTSNAEKAKGPVNTIGNERRGGNRGGGGGRGGPRGGGGGGRGGPRGGSGGGGGGEAPAAPSEGTPPAAQA